jgi:hypothetical protein
MEIEISKSGIRRNQSGRPIAVPSYLGLCSESAALLLALAAGAG